MHTYVSKMIPYRKINMKLNDKEVSLVFDNGVLKLDDDKLAKAFDKLRSEMPAAFSGIVKLDKEKVEEELKAQLLAQKPSGIVKGGITGAHATKPIPPSS